MAKAKRAASGPNQELNRARAQITAAGGIHKGLARYKHTADIGEMRRILPLLVDHPAYRGVFWPDPMPRSYSRLGAGGIPALAGFERELIWCVQTLLPYARLISDFIAEKRRFEEALLRGDQENVWRLLEEIERRFGVSLWLAEANINALQTFKGYSAQQEYADAIARTKGAHPFAGREILRQMQRNRIPTPVLVVTHFDRFGEEGNYMTLDELTEELSDRFSNYMGTVHYRSNVDDWKMALAERLGAHLRQKEDKT